MGLARDNKFKINNFCYDARNEIISDYRGAYYGIVCDQVEG